MSIVNVAFHVKERRVDALIEFDLSFCEGAERSGFLTSVKGELPVANMKSSTVSGVSADSSAPTSLYKAASTGEEDNNDICHRSGTMPFMAIEALDLKLSPYIHDICHDLESIFYTSVWHGVGYRSTESARQKHDILRGWRMGTWEQVVIKKNSFLLDAKDTLRHVKHLWLKQTCWNLAFLFRQRIEAVRNWDWNMEVAAESAAQGQQGAKLRVMSVVHNQPIFPTFADMWGFERVACQKSCCVINTPKRP